ncbi:MAG: hypothetical protein ABSB32_17885 [Thermodesulfobacteriota bacterium]
MSKKKKNKSISTSRILAQSKVKIIKSKQKDSTFWSIKEDLPISLYGELIGWIQNQALLKDKIFSIPFPATPKHLRPSISLIETNPEREFKWGWRYLLPYNKEISYFLDQSQAFENSMPTGDFIKGEQLLSDLEKRLGVSLWLIKNRTALLQIAQGLEAQKKFATLIKQEAIENGIVPFITHYISYRTEPAVTPPRFLRHIDEVFSGLQLPVSIISYLQYHILPDFVPHPRQIAEILQWESSGSAVDYYLALLSMLAHFVSSCLNISDCQKLLPPSNFEVHDPRLEIILNLVRGDQFQPRPINIQKKEAFEAYLAQDLNQAFNLSCSVLKGQPNDYYSMEIVSRCLNMAKLMPDMINENLLSNIIFPIKSIVLKEREYETSARDLIKLSWNFITHSWGKSVLSFVFRELSDDPIEMGKGYVPYATLSNYEPHPFGIMHFQSQEIRTRYAFFLKQIYQGKAYEHYQFACTEEPIKCIMDIMPTEVQLLLTAENIYRSGKYLESLQNAEQLVRSDHSFIRQRGIRLMGNCLIDLNRFEAAVDFIVGHYLREPNLLSILPIKKVVEKIESNERKAFAQNIAIPILYDIYAKRGSRDIDHLRAFVYEDFLFAHGETKPSGLEHLFSQFEKDRLVYFLRYVCSESVMDSSISFDSSEEISLERVAICRSLLELDNANLDIYHSEIKNILRRLTIKKKIREIEQSKIYVDIDSIRDNAEKNLTENFNRYISFLQGGIDEENIALRKSIRESADQGNIAKVLSFALPDNEINSLFEAMIIDLRDQFVSSTEYGRDGYLSVRIRHGTLSSHLRSPLEVNHLITQRNSETGKYRDNTFWIERLNLSEDGVRLQFSKYFSIFSSELDALIDHIIKNWIQIRTTNEQEGLFDFRLIKAQIAFLALKIDANTTFNRFLDITLDSFYEMLELSLEKMRGQIRNEAKTKANDLLTQLQTNIESISRFVDTGDLTAAIGRGRTEIQIAFDRVIEWFRFNRLKEREPFSIEDVISISEASVQISCPAFGSTANISEEMKQLRILGKLPTFVDMLFIIFENIVRHSKSVDPKAEVSVHYQEAMIIIRVVNKVAEGVVCEESTRKIKDIKNVISERKYGEAIRREGGTGFQKLYKILSYDFKGTRKMVEPHLEFGFLPNNSFFAEVGIPILSLREEGGGANENTGN